jgi:hypothetical protein
MGKEGDSDAPLLEDYDAAVNNASDAIAHLQEALRHTNIEQIYRLRLAQIRKTSPLYTGSAARRGLAWLVCIGYLTLIYVVIFYFFYFLTGYSSQIVSTIKSTAYTVYTDLADTYQNIVDPATPQQVAELMTELYDLLAEMGLYDKSLIARPRHLNPAINRTLAEDLNFSPKAIEMMEILPYLDFSGNVSLFNWGKATSSLVYTANTDDERTLTAKLSMRLVGTGKKWKGAIARQRNHSIRLPPGSDKLKSASIALPGCIEKYPT